MVTTAPQSRAIYQASGRVNWFRFFPGLLVTSGVAIVMAWCLFFALTKGFYLILVAPLIAALPVIGVWYVVLRWSHCRNQRVAGITSLALALLLYCGYYHIGLLQLIGVQNAHRIDLLPRYVQIRMQTDVARDAHLPVAKEARQKGPDAVQQVFNWVFFGFEILVVAGLFVGAGRHCASRAYCESCGNWMKRETLKLPSGIGAGLWDSLQRGDYADVQRRLTNTTRQSQIGCGLDVEYCPACPAEGKPQAYLTVKDVPSPGTRDAITAKVGSLFKPRPVAALRSVVNQVALEPNEIGVLASALPGLKKSMETHPDLFGEAQSAAQAIKLAQEGRADDWTGEVARIEAVEPGDAGKVLTRQNAIIQTVIGVTSIFGGIGLAFAPAGVLYSLEANPSDAASAIVVIWMFACFALTLVWVLFFPTYWTSRYMLAQTRRAFDSRLNSAIDLHDPDLFFVDIVPRINWGKAMMENASDIGFLKLDKKRRELIFEGDRERYWIPVESILETKHEFWADSVKHQLQSSPSLNHVVVVRARTADGEWETWFYRRHNKFRPRTAKRRLADAKELEREIRELIASDER